jgi:tungstate transport system substrate-binding protein
MIERSEMESAATLPLIGPLGALSGPRLPRSFVGAGRPVRVIAALGALTAACGGGAPALRLGTTYTVQESGALAVLDSVWTGPPVATVVAPSGQILRAAANGDLDVVITHAPSLEQRVLVDPGHALLRCPLVASRFAVVGPAADPAHAAQATSAAEVFRRIARVRGPFVSRGDSSGTHVKEMALWRRAAVTPDRAWYFESGSDQATTLHIAEERRAYALADLPTYGRLQGLELRILFAADTALTNPYTLYVVRRGETSPWARRFAMVAITSGRAAILAMRLPDGAAAFVTRPGDCGPPSS